MIRKLAAGGEVCHLATSLDTDETQSTRRRREGTARPASRDGVVSASRACLQWAVHLFANKVVIFYYQRRPGRTHITTDRTCIWRFLRLLVRCPGVCIGRSLVVRVAGAGVYSPNTCEYIMEYTFAIASSTIAQIGTNRWDLLCPPLTPLAVACFTAFA